jgi:HAD superfamily phosphoserine phosphatase-like hydrolase
VAASLIIISPRRGGAIFCHILDREIDYCLKSFPRYHASQQACLNRGHVSRNELGVRPIMSKTTIVLVHGLGGHPVTTWGAFPDLIRADPELKDHEVVSFGYPTTLFNLIFWKKYAKIQTLADALRTQLNVRYADRTDFVLACHSLGGLIARRFLVDELKQSVALRVRGLLLYAVPNDGAALAKVASYIGWRNYHLRQLCKDSDLIRELDRDWETTNVEKKIKVRYVVGAQDNVVDEKSARSSWSKMNVEVVADRGHINLVKPKDDKDTPYLILRQFARLLTLDPTRTIERYATPSAANHPAESWPKGRFRVIAFDFDGTLLRGCDYSWSVVWKFLKVRREVSRGAMRDYVTKRITYEEWCDISCKNMRSKNLRRADFSKIVNGLALTKNLQETLATLKTSGFILALISGGIDTFIEEMIPNAAEIFDYICINRIHYDHPSGLVNRIEPTPFDFDGKAVALETICTRHECTLKNSVYVGEGFNDAAVAKVAGLSIAYPPGDESFSSASRVAIEENDLSKILEHVF